MTVDRTVPEVHLHIGDERRSTGQRRACTTTSIRPPARSRDRCRWPGPTTSTTPCRRRRRRVRRPGAPWTPWQRRDVSSGSPSLSSARRRARAAVGARQRHDRRHRPASRRHRSWTTPATTPAGRTRSRAGSRPRRPGPRSWPTPCPSRTASSGSSSPGTGPLVSVGMKVIPALAAGNTVVMKPSELTPYATEHVHGPRPRGRHPGRRRQPRCPATAEAGEALVRHPLVQKVSFTGGPTTARASSRRAPRRLKPAVLELGGKSANIVFPDADLDGRRLHRHRVGPPDPRRSGLRARDAPRRARQRLRRAGRRRSSPSPGTSRWVIPSIRRPAWARS